MSHLITSQNFSQSFEKKSERSLGALLRGGVWNMGLQFNRVTKYRNKQRTLGKQK